MSYLYETLGATEAKISLNAGLSLDEFRWFKYWEWQKVRPAVPGLTADFERYVGFYDANIGRLLPWVQRQNKILTSQFKGNRLGTYEIPPIPRTMNAHASTARISGSTMALSKFGEAQGVTGIIVSDNSRNWRIKTATGIPLITQLFPTLRPEFKLPGTPRPGEIGPLTNDVAKEILKKEPITKAGFGILPILLIGGILVSMLFMRKQ